MPLVYHLIAARSFATAAEMQKAFYGGIDFKISNPDIRGTYCSVRDFKEGDIIELTQLSPPLKRVAYL